ncbi:hypothetical protein [Streptomyces sp. NPDC050388]|uniref:hypothetical protein n=1 Tax=Streptomyces sp. NPDC050388 TaxID=3155781 RepID=UPI00341E1377
MTVSVDKVRPFSRTEPGGKVRARQRPLLGMAGGGPRAGDALVGDLDADGRSHHLIRAVFSASASAHQEGTAVSGSTAVGTAAATTGRSASIARSPILTPPRSVDTRCAATRAWPWAAVPAGTSP